MSQINNFRQIEKSLDKLTKEELITLNRAIVKRIRMINDAQRLMANAAFDRGDKVSWNDMEGNEHTGYVIRVNKKTISVQEPDAPEFIWRIPAVLLRKLPEY